MGGPGRPAPHHGRAGFGCMQIVREGEGFGLGRLSPSVDGAAAIRVCSEICGCVECLGGGSAGLSALAHSGYFSRQADRGSEADRPPPPLVEGLFENSAPGVRQVGEIPRL
eukprot:2514660-Pyramimonas_sp.AAC.1